MSKVLIEQETITSAENDFDSIQAAIISQGVKVPNGTSTSAYASKILQIEGGGTPGDGEIESNDLDDPAVVYKKTRPNDWLTMPDVSENEIYLLFHLYPPTKNLIAFAVTCTDSYTIEYGITTNKQFSVIGSTTVSSGTIFEGAFLYEDWGNETSSSARQIMIKITGTDITSFVQSTHSERNYASYKSWNIVDIKGNLPSCTSFFDGLQGGGVGVLQQLKYFSLEGTNSITSGLNMFAGLIGLVTILHLDTSKMTNAQNLFRSCTSLMALPSDCDFSNATNISYMFMTNTTISRIPETWTFSKATNITSMFNGCSSLIYATIDITSATAASTILTSCYSLKSVKFKYTGTKTTFPTAISLQYSSVSASAVEEFFNTLPTISTSRSIDIRNTPAALTITDKQKKIAEDKNWTVQIV